MTASSPHVQAYYRDCAAQYQLFCDVLGVSSFHFGMTDGMGTPDSDLRLVDRVIEAIAPIATDVILDAGCGNGAVAKRLSAFASTIALDLVLDHCRQANRRLPARVTQGSYDRLPFADASVNVVTMFESFCHAPDKRRVLVEMARVLRPGGRLAIADAFLARHPSPRERGVLSDWARGWAVPSLPYFSSFRDELAATGLIVEHCSDISEEIGAYSVALARASSMALPLLHVAWLLGLATSAERANVSSAILQHEVGRSGLCRYAIVVASKPRADVERGESPFLP
jgi:ubiquinone/menaquinone biosynthesis C-methylase UbiE